MFRNWKNARLLLAPDKGDGDGENEGGGPTPGTLPDAVMKSFERLMARHDNDAASVGRLLFDENRNLRETVRTLQGKVPADNALILSGDDANAWAAYQALGKPDELKQGLESRAQLQGKLDALDREATLRGVAEVAGYKPTVLSQLDRMAASQGKALTFSLREQTVDGQVVKTAVVKDGEAETPLADYATANWSDFLPALAAQGAAAPTPSPTPGLRFPAQHPGGNGGQGSPDLVTKFQQEQAEKDKAVKNPLLKN